MNIDTKIIENRFLTLNKKQIDDAIKEIQTPLIYNLDIQVLKKSSNETDVKCLVNYMKCLKTTVKSVDEYKSKRYVDYLKSFFVFNASNNEYTVKTINILNKQIPLLSLVKFNMIELDNLTTDIVVSGKSIDTASKIYTINMNDIVIDMNDNYDIRIVQTKNKK